MHPGLWQMLPPNHPKPTGIKQPSTPQSLTECQHSPKKPAATCPPRSPMHQGWDRPVLGAPMGGWAAPWHNKRLPHASSHPHGLTMRWINGSWPTALGMAPKLVAHASPILFDRMSCRSRDLLLLVVLLLFVCVEGVKGLQGLPFESCSSKEGGEGS